MKELIVNTPLQEHIKDIFSRMKKVVKLKKKLQLVRYS